MKNITIVTALFNIEREGVDGRKWDDYLKWFDITLRLKCPMVIFVTEDIREFVEQKRLTIPTDINVQTIEEIPYYHLNDKMHNILSSTDYQQKVLDSDRIECKYPMHPIINFSKFKWMKQVSEQNPYNSDFIFWLDAGASRFFENFDLGKEFPSESAMEALEEMGESFLVQMNCDYYPDLFDAKELSLLYLYDNRSYVLGSLFGGHKNVVPEICDFVDNVFINDMIEKNIVNNEQIVLGYLIKKYPDKFTLYHRTNGKHMDLFLELTK